MSVDKSLFDRVGGKATLMKVHSILYTKVYAHPWLKQYFTDKPQDILENQQTSFMGQLFGGPKSFAGKTPKFAHQHMLISEELFNLRHQLLADSLNQAGIPAPLQQEWLDADATFKRALIKTSEDQCKRAYAIQPILNFPNPDKGRNSATG